jgi:hypothetical protein
LWIVVVVVVVDVNVVVDNVVVHDQVHVNVNALDPMPREIV